MLCKSIINIVENRQRLSLIFFIFFLFSINISFGATPLSQKKWSSITTHDLIFSYQAINRIVPYTFFQSEPGLHKWLKNGYSQALDEANTVSSYKTYKIVMKKYIEGFNIEHLEIDFHSQHSSNHVTKKQKVLQVVTHPFSENSIWIIIPSFQAGEKTFNHPRLEKSLKKLIADLPRYRNKNLLVFDVRGNGGGSDVLSRSLIVSLYSKQYLRSLGPSFIWNQQWRVIDSLVPEASHFFGHHAKVLAAMKQGYRLYESSFWPVSYGQQENKSFQHWPNPVKAHVVILADNRCGSMCYQFTRTLLELPHTVLVGQSPNVMERLTNPVSIILPSRQATLHIGTREMMSPAYAFGRRLIPKYQYSGDLNNTRAVEKWILTLYRAKEL